MKTEEKLAANTTKYVDIQKDLRFRITKGEFKTGVRLPPDRELHKQYNVNRQTMIKALEGLAREGLIVRQPNSGTFVADFSQTPFIKGKFVKLGILSSQRISTDSFRDNFVGSILKGILSEWGVSEKEPHLTHKNTDMVTRAVLDESERGLKIIFIGNPQEALTNHPTIESVACEFFDGIISVGIYDNIWLEKLLDLGIPTILVDHPTRKFAGKADKVYVDPQPGYGEVVDFIVNKKIETIHYVGLKTWECAPNNEMTVEEWLKYRVGKEQINDDSYLRMSAVKQSLMDHDKILPDNNIHYIHSGEKEVLALANKLIDLETKPEAIICHDAGMAHRFVNFFKEKGFKLVGAGAATMVDSFPKSVFPIRVGHVELGLAAAELLVTRLKRPDRQFLNVGISCRLKEK